jgi:hypothetical protein
MRPADRKSVSLREKRFVDLLLMPLVASLVSSSPDSPQNPSSNCTRKSIEQLETSLKDN